MTSRPLLLVGAGGLAREVLAAVTAGNSVRPEWNVLGFCDDDPAQHGRLIDGLPVLGPVDAVHEHPDAAVVICAANTRNHASRKLIGERLGLPAERYATVVHPTASIGAGTAIGAGSVFLASPPSPHPRRSARTWRSCRRPCSPTTTPSPTT